MVDRIDDEEKRGLSSENSLFSCNCDLTDFYSQYCTRINQIMESFLTKNFIKSMLNRMNEKHEMIIERIKKGSGFENFL